jgi:hypothetical protein
MRDGIKNKTFTEETGIKNMLIEKQLTIVCPHKKDGWNKVIKKGIRINS